MELAAARHAQKLLTTESQMRVLQSELRSGRDSQAAAVAAMKDEHWRAQEQAEWSTQEVVPCTQSLAPCYAISALLPLPPNRLL